MQKECYFCQEVDLNFCLTKSLYNKHNDTPDKRGDIIDSLMDLPRCEQQQQEHQNSKRQLLRYKQILHMNDDHQNLTEYLQDSNKDLKELLEYYKYRVYVPLFRKSACVNTIHCYYYQKLKLYYNGIKRRLNMTVVDSQQTNPVHSNHLHSEDGQYDEDFGYDEDFMKQLKRNKNSKVRNRMSNKKQQKSKKDSKLLKGITIQESEGLVAYQTESKALQNLVKLLKRNQKLKKVQTLKTEDCQGSTNQFRDKNQRIVFPLHEFSRKGKYDAATTAYIKYKLVAKSKTKPSTNISNSNSKSYKKLKDYQQSQNLRKKSIQPIKIPQKQTSLRYLRSKQNKLLLQKNSKNSFMNEQKQIYRSIEHNKQGLKLTRYGSMPKVTMKFDGKPIRSSSTGKIESVYQKNLGSYAWNLNSVNKMATLSPYKQSLLRNEKAAAMIEANQIRSGIKKIRVQSQRTISNNKQANQLNPKDKLVLNRGTGNIKKIKACGFEMQSTDNIINIRKKKLEALKARSDRKKIN